MPKPKTTKATRRPKRRGSVVKPEPQGVITRELGQRTKEFIAVRKEARALAKEVRDHPDLIRAMMIGLGEGLK